MHELSITQSVVDAVLDRLPDTRIAGVQLEIGKLSGIVADSVRFCFDLVVAGTLLEGARLDIDEPGGRARCAECDTEFDVDDLILLCPCGSANVAVLTGQQLRIRSVEVV
ncbi:MAG TPA: hydrogenase maturation nickel metallochaperone HypA [Pseudonocardiaceae bacterium]